MTETDLQELEKKYGESNLDVSRLMREVRWLRDQCIKTAGDLTNALQSQARFAQEFRKKLEASRVRSGVRSGPVGGRPEVPPGDKDAPSGAFGPDGCRGVRGG